MLQHTWFLLLIFSNKSISILIGRPHPRPVRSAPTLGLRPSRKIVSDPEPCGRNPNPVGVDNRVSAPLARYLWTLCILQYSYSYDGGQNPPPFAFADK